MNLRGFRYLFGVVIGMGWTAIGLCQSSSVGLFEGHQSIGKGLLRAQRSANAAKQSYRVPGSGENMWFGMDDFQFVWKEMTGDVAIPDDISFVGAKGNGHQVTMGTEARMLKRFPQRTVN